MAREVTVTGGRDATTRYIAGDYALCVGEPKPPAPLGWKWYRLSDIARLESGHTPSRRHSEYWNGDIPWMGLRDAKTHHGGLITTTAETTNELGISNSSARILPAGTVCLSRTASVGYVVIMGRDMATSQDFVNWTCTPQLDPRFLQYLLIAEQQALRRFSAGAVHPTIYYPEVKAFHVCIPPLPEQKRIVAILDEAFEGIDKAIANTEKNLTNVMELFGAHLEAACRQVAAASPSRPLAELCKSDRVITYGVIKLGEHLDDGIPCLRTSNVRWLHIDEDGMKRISPTLSHDYRRTILSGGEVLVNVRGTLGGVAVSSSHMAGWNVSREVAVIPLDPSQAVADFVAYCVGSRSSQRWLSGVLKGVAYTGINIEDLRNLPVPTPSLTEQQKVAETLGEALGNCRSAEDAYTRKLLALRELRQLMLAQAFSGHLSGLSGLTGAAA